jgi:UDP-N-acetylmuramoyl-L-alanyl-D-glutamate--2,6-diaminopimelate ligase
MNALAINGVDYVAMEASSHGLDQKRMHSIKVKAAAFTSFGHDHLDYHKNMREYLDAKLILFEDNLIDGGLAIINSDIENLDYIIKRLESSSINYITIGSSGNVVINIVESSLKGQQIEFTYKNKKYRFFTEILGGFQASNIIIAALLVESCGFDFEKIVNLLPRLIPVQGRLQRITAPSYSFQVFVDYAHTPDSLDKSLKELEALKKPNSKLFVVFGCGGNRDKTKRPEMGKIAKEIADIVIVTDDNPRFEDPAIIRKEIIAEVPEAIEIGDRAKAINHAIKSMQEGDILLIAGKGHEDYQLVAGQKIDFSDAETAFGALK